MTHHEQPQVEAEPKKDEPIFGFGVIGIGDELCPLICEDRLCLDEVDAVLLEVRGSFDWISLDAKFVHAGNITTM